MSILDAFAVNILYGDTGSTEQAINDTFSGIPTAEELGKSLKSGAIDRFLDSLPDKLIEFGIRVLLTLIVVFIGIKVIGLIRKIVRKAMEKGSVEKGVIQFTDGLIKAVLGIVLILWVAVNFGVQATSVAALISSVSIAIGLALQGSLSNFAGGLLILILKPFKVGDYIREDTYGNEGTVKEISLFYTKLLSYDNKTIILPNGTLANTSMANFSQDGKRKVDLKVEVSYDADIKFVREKIFEVLGENKNVLQDMQKLVYVHELASNGVKIGVRCYTNADTYFPLYWELLEGIKIKFDESGIGIPYPQVDVHLESRGENIH